MAFALTTTPGKRATLIYTVALLVIGLLIISSQLLIGYVLDNQSADSRVINISGRQSMLSQKLAKLSLLLGQAKDAQEISIHRQDLIYSLNLWEQSHYALQNGDTSLQIPTDHNSETVRGLFEGLNPSFLQIKEIIHRIYDDAYSNTSDQFASDISSLVARETEFSEIMNIITFQYDHEAKQKVEKLERMEWILMFVILIALLLAALLIFRPAVKKLDSLIYAAQIKRKRLEKANEDLAQKNLVSHQQTEKIADQHFQLKQQNKDIIKANEKLTLTQGKLEQVIAEREVYNQELQAQKQEVELAQKELHKLAVVVRETNNGVIITDANGKVEYINEGFSTITGYRLEEVIGKKPGEILQGEDTDQSTIREIRESLKKQVIFSGEILNYHKDGSSYWLYLNICPVFNEKHELTNFIAIETDISQQKQRSNLLEDQKESLQQMLQELQQTQTQLVYSEKLSSLGQLTAGIAHEINNPINFVLAGIQTLKAVLEDIQQLTDFYNDINSDLSIDDIKTRLTAIDEFKEEIVFEELNDDLKHLLADILVGAERTQNIVKSLQTFTHLDENEQKPADIHENLEATLTLLHSKFDGHISLHKDYDDTLPFIVCNVGQINQVFMNLLDNASQSIKGKGKIAIKTRMNKESQCAEIIISDSGVGMDTSTMDKIFEPFFTTKAAGQGTGLGLAISTNIIEKHQGSIKVESQLGRGSTFTVCLPITS